MRIALTHNVQLMDSEEQAEFDRPETIAVLCAALRELGHEVHPVEVSGPVAPTVARLEALAPELVFNTAEGRRGRFREALYPALLDELGLPYTGSDAYVCALTLDKHLTKKVVVDHDVPVARGVFVHSDAQAQDLDLRLPVILKPNFEGSSKGITRDSVVVGPRAVRDRLRDALERFPDGILVEEFIEGRDIAVPFLEGIQPATGGVLEPAEYVFAGAPGTMSAIYDYELKQVDFDAVTVRVPARLSDELRERVIAVSRRAIRALGVRDLGRIDYRVTPSGELYFLEINALPSLEPGASLYASARLAGLDAVSAVLDAVVRSALRRRGIQPERQARARVPADAVSAPAGPDARDVVTRERHPPVVRCYQLDVERRLRGLPGAYKVEVIGEARGHPLYAVTSPNAPSRVLVTGGVHGSEPAGVLTALDVLERHASTWAGRVQLVVIPCVNPWGFERCSRRNADGVNLNETFHAGSTAAEAVAVMRKLAGERFDLSVDIHETNPFDSSGADTSDIGPHPLGFYLYEFCDDDGRRIGPSLIRAVASAGVSIERATVIYDDPARDGVIAYPEAYRGPVGLDRRSLDGYVFQRHAPHSLCLETPTHLALGERARAHRVAIDAALAVVVERAALRGVASSS